MAPRVLASHWIHRNSAEEYRTDSFLIKEEASLECSCIRSLLRVQEFSRSKGPLQRGLALIESMNFRAVIFSRNQKSQEFPSQS